ncbi:MAG TPA: hypothetical protein VLG69_03555 [Candidatus Andersenbacteria bacterium]|nr:hypothetical protein [Candidatus Andersenbacteria bacterium]
MTQMLSGADVLDMVLVGRDLETITSKIVLRGPISAIFVSEGCVWIKNRWLVKKKAGSKKENWIRAQTDGWARMFLPLSLGEDGVVRAESMEFRFSIYPLRQCMKYPL